MADAKQHEYRQKDRLLSQKMTSRQSDSSVSVSFDDSELGENNNSTSGYSSEMPKRAVTREQKQSQIKNFIKELKDLLDWDKKGTVPVLQEVVTAVKNLRENSCVSFRSPRPENSTKSLTPKTSSSVPEYYTKLELGKDSKNEFVWQLKTSDFSTLKVDEKIKSILGLHTESIEGRLIKEYVHPEDVGLLEMSLSLVKQEFAADKAIPEEDMKPYMPEKWFFIRLRKRSGLVNGYGLKDGDLFITVQVSLSVNVNTDNGTKSRPRGDEPTSKKPTSSSHSVSDVPAVVSLICSPVISFYTVPDSFPRSAVFQTRHDISSCMFSKVHPNIVPLMGYLPQIFLDTPVYDLYYIEDLPHLYRIYAELIHTKGNSRISHPIRMLARNGHYVVVNTEWCGFVSPSTDRLVFIMGKHEIICGPSDPDILKENHRKMNVTRTEDQLKAVDEFKKLLVQATTGNIENVKRNESEMKFFTDESDCSLSYHQMNYRDCIRRYLYSQLSVSHDTLSDVESVTGLDDLSGPSSGSGTRGFCVVMSKPQSLDSSTKALVSDHDQLLEDHPPDKRLPSESVDDIQATVETLREETPNDVNEPNNQWCDSHDIDSIDEMHRTPTNPDNSNLCPLTEESLRQHTKIQERLYLITSKKQKLYRDGMHNSIPKRSRSTMKSSSCSGHVSEVRYNTQGVSYTKTNAFAPPDSKRQKTKGCLSFYDRNEARTHGAQIDKLPKACRPFTSVSVPKVQFPFCQKFGVSVPSQDCYGVGQSIPVSGMNKPKALHTSMIDPTSADLPNGPRTPSTAVINTPAVTKSHAYNADDNNITSSSSQNDLDCSRQIVFSRSTEDSGDIVMTSSQISSSLTDVTKDIPEHTTTQEVEFQITKKESCRQLNKDRVSLGNMPQSELVVEQLKELLKQLETAGNDSCIDEEADLLFFDSEKETHKCSAIQQQAGEGAGCDEKESRNTKENTWDNGNSEQSFWYGDSFTDDAEGFFPYNNSSQYGKNTESLRTGNSNSRCDNKLVRPDDENCSDTGNKSERKKSGESSPPQSKRDTDMDSTQQIGSQPECTEKGRRKLKVRNCDHEISKQNCWYNKSLSGKNKDVIPVKQESRDNCSTELMDSDSNSDDKLEESDNKKIADTENDSKGQTSGESSPVHSKKGMSHSSSGDRLSLGSSQDGHGSEKSSQFPDSIYFASDSSSGYRQSSSDITPSDERSEDCISSFKESDGTGKECKKIKSPPEIARSRTKRNDKVDTFFSQLFVPLQITLYSDMGASVSTTCKSGVPMDFEYQMEYQMPRVNYAEILEQDRAFLRKTIQPELIREQVSELMNDNVAMELDTLMT